MKKYVVSETVVVFILFALCASFTYGIETTDSTPVIEGVSNQNELITVNAFNVTRIGVPGIQNFQLRDINAVPTEVGTVQVTRFLVAALQYMYNGDYILRTRIRDLTGNNANATYPFTINGQGQQIVLVEPRNGGTTTRSLNFTIDSEYTSECRWTNASLLDTPVSAVGFGFMRPFTVTDGLRHRIINFAATTNNSLAPNQPVPVLVMCLYDGVYTPREFSVTYLATPPTLTATSTPNPIIDPQNPVTAITVQSNQEVWCDDIPQASIQPPTYASFGPNEYASYGRAITTQYLDYPNPDVLTREVQLICFNRAGMEMRTNHTIRLAYTEQVAITFSSPTMVARAPYNLTFTTNKMANCTARMNAAPHALNVLPPEQAQSFRSNTTTTLTGSTTTFTVTCTTLFTQSRPFVATHRVRFDNEPPRLQAIVAEPNTCSLERVRFRLNATDGTNGTNITTIEYSIMANGTGVVSLVNVTANNELRVESPRIRLVNGTRIIISARVYDAAGNPSQRLEKNITATGSNLVVCDVTPPSVRITQNRTTAGMNVRLECFDLQSRCTNTFQYNVRSLNESGACVINVTQTGTAYNTTQLVTRNSTYCYRVLDNNGNEARGQQIIRINVTGNNNTPILPPVNKNGTCSDGVKNRDETDIDCGGGICGTLEKKFCAPLKGCELFADCASNVCIAGFCEASSCTNARQDGTETDIDCGGTACVTEGFVCSEGQRCKLNADCVSGTRCISSGLCGQPIQEEEPAPVDEPVGGDSFNFMKLIFIVLGALLMISGVGYSVLYAPPRVVQETNTVVEPLTRFRPRGEEHGDEISSVNPEENAKARAKRHKKRERIRSDRDNTIKAFDSTDDLTSLEHITHNDVERAFKELDKDKVQGAVQEMLDNEKVLPKDVSVALKDLEASGTMDTEAIDELKKAFGLDKEK